MIRRVIVIALLCLSDVALAQPVTSGGLRTVTHGVSLSGAGTVASPLSVRVDCADGEIIKWDAGSTAWLCSTDDTVGGGAVTGSGSTNALPKFTAAAVLGDSLLTDNATTLAYNTNKFTVAAATGNAAIAGTLSAAATSVTTLTASGAVTDTGNRVFSVAGDGLESSGATVSVNVGAGLQLVSDEVTYINTVIQSRVSGTCTAPQAVTGIASNGTVTCTTNLSGGSGTSGRSTRWTGTNTLANGALTDDGTNASIAGTFDTTGTTTTATGAGNYLQVGRATSLTSSNTGWRVFPFTDNNIYIDHKLGTSGSVFFRTGQGTEAGDTRTWLTVTSSTGAVQFGSTLGATGLVTATAGVTTPANLTTTGTGDLVVADAATISGNITIGSTSANSHQIVGVTTIVGVNENSYLMFGANQDLYVRGGKAVSSINIGDATNTGGINLGSATNHTVNIGNFSVQGNGAIGNASGDAHTLTGTLSANGGSPYLGSNGQTWMGDTANGSIGNNLDVLTIGNAGTGRTTSAIALIKATETGSYDTTAADIFSYAVRAENTSTRSAGANSVNKIAFYANTDTQTGTNPYNFYGAGTGSIYNAGSIVIDGNTTLGSSALKTTLITGIVTIIGSLNGWTQVSQGADQDVTNAGLTDSNTLTISVTANKIYALDAFIIAGGNDTTGDYIFDFAVAAGTMDCTGTEQSVSTLDAIQNTSIIATAAADTADTSVGTRADASLPIAIRITLACKVSNTTTFKYRFGNAAASSGRTSRTMAGSYLKWELLN